MELKSIEDILKLINNYYIIEKKPIKYDEFTGKAIKFEEKKHYQNIEEINIGIKGSFTNYVIDKKFMKYLLSKKVHDIGGYYLYYANKSNSNYTIIYYRVCKK